MDNSETLNPETLKELVREKYGQIAREGSCGGETSCCGPVTCANETAFVNFSDDYTQLDGYVEGADLGLGCGIPTQDADLKPGQVVLDLGSGAGNDVFVAREIVGESGKVIGVDMTPDMIKKARENAALRNFSNVDFRLGEIEALPVETASVDRIVSNCVLNLVPNKQGAFAEMFRVLKAGGRFGISDVVLEGVLPEELKKAAELYVGCVSGAIQKAEYLALMAQAGFGDIRVTKEKVITLPHDLLEAYLTPAQRKALDQSEVHILSITVCGTKPGTKAETTSETTSETKRVTKSEACCSPTANGSACC